MLTQLRTMRQLKGLKLKELSSKIGISASFLSRIEKGKMSGSIETRVKIAKVLGVSVENLFGAR